MQGRQLKPKLVKSIVDEILQSTRSPLSRCAQLTVSAAVQGRALAVGSLLLAHCHLQSHEGQDGPLALPSKVNLKSVPPGTEALFLRPAY